MKKTEEEKREEIKAEIERVKELIEKVNKKIAICPGKEGKRLMNYCEERKRLEAEKYRLTNLLNIIK